MDGLAIPPRTRIVIPIHQMHHLEEVWGNDHNEFNPDRFVGESFTKNELKKYSFMPFGMGLKSCVGFQLALLEARLVIARLFARYKFELVDVNKGGAIPLRFDVTLSPRTLPLKISKRN